MSVCAGLVTVDGESNIVRLVHYTTQEYFLHIRDAWNPTAQQEITTICLTYLSFDPFRSGSCGKTDFKKRLAKYRFLKYACRYWSQHAQTVQEQVSELAFAFLRDRKLVSCALQLRPEFRSPFIYRAYMDRFKHATGVHITARFGLQYLLAGLLSGTGGASSMPADSTDKTGRTPLSWAAYEGSTATAKLLVERDDVDVNSKDKFSLTPLAHAAREGHEAIVKLLLKQKDIDADMRSGMNYMTPLWWAAVEYKHDAIVKLLLEREDVGVNMKDHFLEAPLLKVARGGQEAILKLLLERKDIEADTRDRQGRTSLFHAAHKGHEAIVKLLLARKDVEPNAKDANG